MIGSALGWQNRAITWPFLIADCTLTSSAISSSWETYTERTRKCISWLTGSVIGTMDYLAKLAFMCVFKEERSHFLLSPSHPFNIVSTVLAMSVSFPCTSLHLTAIIKRFHLLNNWGQKNYHSYKFFFKTSRIATPARPNTLCSLSCSAIISRSSEIGPSPLSVSSKSLSIRSSVLTAESNSFANTKELSSLNKQTSRY